MESTFVPLTLRRDPILLTLTVLCFDNACQSWVSKLQIKLGNFRCVKVLCRNVSSYLEFFDETALTKIQILVRMILPVKQISHLKSTVEELLGFHSRK